jgi:antibiotic biosynthesis monooxygenase (ABM) superfamily enzyme
MNHLPNAAQPRPQLSNSGASSVIVQRVPEKVTELFMGWQNNVTAEASQFPGYQSTDVYPPSDSHQQEWVIVLRFDDKKSLQAWLDSPNRAACLAKLPAEIRDFRLKIFSSGLDFWFPGPGDGGTPIPHWKKFLVVLLGLYPTVILLSWFLSPHTKRFGLAIAVLIGNIASVAFLEWLGMPVINRIVNPWVHANEEKDKKRSLIGLFWIVGVIGIMLLLFWLLTPYLTT